MNFLNRFKFPALAGILFVVVLVSCEQDLTTIGSGVIGGEPFVTDKAVFDVFAYNKKITAVQTNQLPVYQLGVYTDPVYGKTEAHINSQVQLVAYDPVFGDWSAATEIDSARSERETIDSVYIYIPYINDKLDSDSDGVVDVLDIEPFDGTNDSDGDNVPNNEEVANNTDPNMVDTDGDGINDDVDESTLGSRFPETFQLDSIYLNNERFDQSTDVIVTPPYIGTSFEFKLERSTFFLRDLDPSSNFQEAQEYYSTQQFSPSFTEEVFYDGPVTISDQEIVFLETEDDPDTDDDEIGTITSRLDPGIYVKLNDVANTFFQENILDREGGSELLSSLNFKEFFRGVYLSATPTTEDLMMILDITGAKFDVFYTYEDIVDDVAEDAQDSFEVRLVTESNTLISGNAINTFVNENYPAEITSSLDSDENAERIYLKGGAGSYAEIQLFGDLESEAETLINQIKANNWIINEANLVFNIDTDAIPANAIEPPRLYLYNSETNTPIYNADTETNETDTALGIYLNYDGIIEKSADGSGLKYTVKITEHINNIIVRDSSNVRLGLGVTADIRISGANNTMLPNGVEKELPAASILTPLGTVLYGSNVSEANEAKKLQLEIFYTETN